MRELWRQLPPLLKIQAVSLAAVLSMPFLVVHGTPDRGYEQVAFAVPAADALNRPWHAEVDAFASKVSQAFGVRRGTANEFAIWILEASERHDLDPELLASLVHTESTFRKHARSPVGAIGPAQVRPEFWSQFCGAADLRDPAENIYCGAQVLSHLRDVCGDEQCALRAYNVGQYSTQHQAARRYVAKIDRARDQLRKTEL
jgi:soluble lytic murein transglycosylase-like protein